MSRLTSLSANAVQAMFSTETQQQLIMLVTIYDPADLTGNAIALRLADTFTKRLDPPLTTDSEIVYGVTSRSNDYIFLPLQITLPTENDTGTGGYNINLNYTSPEIVQLIRTQLTKPTKVLLELVLGATPNTVEVSFSDFYITSVTYNQQQITLSLEMISLSREPFPAFNFTPGYFPGLF
jgi:hypothetical protein